jgi:hypothetical protein
MSENKRGRPLKWESPEEIQGLIDQYFNETPMSRWTITGLALALDTNRHTLINYSEREDFFHTINKAKLMVENAYEIDLREKGHAGNIFALKNFGWKDKTEVDATINQGKLTSLLEQFDDTDTEA